MWSVVLYLQTNKSNTVSLFCPNFKNYYQKILFLHFTHNNAYLFKYLAFCLFFSEIVIKGTASVISSDPPCKDGNARFTTVPLKP